MVKELQIKGLDIRLAGDTYKMTGIIKNNKIEVKYLETTDGLLVGRGTQYELVKKPEFIGEVLGNAVVRKILCN